MFSRGGGGKGKSEKPGTWKVNTSVFELDESEGNDNDGRGTCMIGAEECASGEAFDFW